VRVSIAELGEMPHKRFVDFVRLCETLRYDGLYHADEKWTRDVWARLGIAAMASDRLMLGTSVTDGVTRHPALAAQAAATIAEATGGRLTLGFGAGSHFETLPGYEVVRPAVAIRDSIEIMRRMWAGERVTYEGEVMQFLGGKLDFPLDPALTPKVWVATRGVHVLRMSGEVADGVILGSFATQWGIDYGKREIAKGLERSGRSWDDITLASWLYVCILDDEDDPVPEGIRRGVSHALWSSRAIIEPVLDEITDDLPDDFRTFLRDAPHHWSPDVMAELRRLIPRGLIDAMSVVGTADVVRDRLLALESMGVQEVIIWPFPERATVRTTRGSADVEDFAIRFADQIMPALTRAGSRGEYQLVD
jgi:5,10-methylenetetrahydromethanopterin reductase